MEVPVGFLATLWTFITFLPFFFLLLVLGVLKALIIGPIATLIVLLGNISVIIGLWPAHFFWTYLCVIKTKRFGFTLKSLVLLSLPLPLILWPPVGILGSLLGGIGYGFFAPLGATFEAVGEGVADKFYHCFTDGCWSTIKGACTEVQDFTDFCFHSYFSFMDELTDVTHVNEKPLEVRLSRLPGCALVSMIAVPVDVLAITGVALWKSPYMLLRGWQRMFADMIGREGPFLETVCVPFAGLAILLWPLAVVGSVIAAFGCSFFLALYSGAVAYQENSFSMGLAYIVSIISLFDEYTNDMLYLREGSCFPRPRYRNSIENKHKVEQTKGAEENSILQREKERLTSLASQRSRTLRKAIQQLKPIQIWDWLFKSCEINGRILLSEGIITVADIEECIRSGRSKKLRIKLPAWCLFQCLIRSAKSDSHGLLISDEVELTNFNWPKDRVLEWILGPLLIMKDQIKGMNLDENEESYLRKLILIYNNEKPQDWDNTGFPSDDKVRRAQLQAIFRRLQGIVASLSRMPTFRRKFHNLVKTLYVEAKGEAALKEIGSIKSVDSQESGTRSSMNGTLSNDFNKSLDIV